MVYPSFERLIVSALCCLLIIATAEAEDKHLLINELMQSNVDCIMDDLNDFPDSWVELYNPSDETVDLQGYRLGITSSAEVAWRLPASQIPPHGYIVVYCDKVGKGLHAPFRLESGKGGNLYLFQGSDLADKLTDLAKQPAPNIAYGRETDGNEVRGFLVFATPGYANCGKTCKSVLGEPVFSEPGIVKSDGGQISLELSLPAGVPGETVIVYTLDGSEPSLTNGRVYNGRPISISTTLTVRARLFCEGWISPRSTTHSYIFHPRKQSLPVISVTTDERYLTDTQIGICVRGSYNKEKPNYEYNWRRPAQIELFDGEGIGSAINQLCEIRVMGGASRKSPLKSLILYAHKRFGKKRLEYEFFPDQKPGLVDFKSVLLRNAGNDFDHLYMRDAVIQRSVAQFVDLDWQAWRPAVIYINGKYKGILNIRERSTEDNIYTNYGGLEDIDMVENWKDLKTGDWNLYNRFIEYVKEGGHSLEDYERYIDWQEFINLMVMNLYFNNQDFPSNNIVMWRPRAAGGRWRFVAKDTDFGLGIWNAPASYNTIKWLYTPGYDRMRNVGNTPEATFLFRKMMENSDFCREFIDRACVYMGDFLNGRGVGMLMESMYENVEAELPYHLEMYRRTLRNYQKEFQDAIKWAEERTLCFYQQIGDFFQLGEPVCLKVNRELASELPADISLNGVRLSSGSFNGYFYPNRELTISAAGQTGTGSVSGWEVSRTEGGNTTKSFFAGSSITMKMPVCDLLSVNAITGNTGGISENKAECWTWAVSGDRLEVYDVEAGIHVSLFNTRGMMLVTGSIADGKTVVMPRLDAGIYILKVGGKAIKVIIR